MKTKPLKREKFEENFFFETKSPSKIDEWSLVLTALNIPHEVKYDGEGARLIVPEKLKDKALEELALYEEENSCPQISSSPHFVPLESAFWTFLILTALLSAGFEPEIRIVLERGIGDSTAILSGQWWRTITALALHQDPPHLLGNMLFGSLFFLCVRVVWPAGLLWFCLILGGALGNYLSCLIKGKGFLFLGASTAVFSAVGILSALKLRQGSRRDIFLAVGLGLAFLGILGSAGKNTDLVGHLCGLLTGFLLGLTVDPFKNRLKAYDPYFKIASLALVSWAWFKALNF